MAGYSSGIIKLNSPRDVFYSGQVVSGSVVIVLNQPLTLSVLHINYLGEATVFWKEIESEEYNGVKRYKEVQYNGREEYFNITQVLGGGNAPVALPPGTHTYKFNYQIPPGVPSSFTGQRGKVTYSINATVELKQGPPGNYTELTDRLEKIIEVVSPFNLNLGSPQLKEPIDLEFEEVYGCGCFNSDPVNIRVRLPVSGYCPGQVIPVALEVDNNSSIEVRKMIFEILRERLTSCVESCVALIQGYCQQRVRYRTQRPVSEFVPPEKVLTSVQKGAVMSGTKRNYTIDVKLPELIAPNLENCGIIDVGYFFRVKIKLSGCNDDLEDESEICLGLVPLNESLNGEYVHPLSDSLPIGPIPDIPPPNTGEETRQTAAHQESAYPTGPTPFPNPQYGYPNPPYPQTGYPNAPPPFSTAQSGYPFPMQNTEKVQGSYVIQVQQQQYSSTDPSQNFNIGFTMTSPPGSQVPAVFSDLSMPPFPDLKINLPPVNVTAPSAPPPSS